MKPMTTLMIAALLSTSAVPACKGGQESATPKPANVVQREMRLLDEAMEITRRGIASGDLHEVPHALHRVHEARHETEHAVESGAYRPPKNPAQIHRFHELDTAFHEHLEHIVEAARKNDVAATKEAYETAAKACDGCHAEFRR